jgi:hypothetical protein
LVGAERRPPISWLTPEPNISDRKEELQEAAAAWLLLASKIEDTPNSKAARCLAVRVGARAMLAVVLSRRGHLTVDGDCRAGAGGFSDGNVETNWGA